MSETYRVTWDASHKVKYHGGHAQTFLQHVARDVDLANGVVMSHANPNIDPGRTHLNETVVPDGDGGWVRPGSMEEEIMGRLAARLATVKKSPKANAVALRPVVANLSKEWFDEHNPDWRENGLNEQARAAYAALLAQAAAEYGADNIPVASLHMDESLPQWQIPVAMVTDDGRLNQKEWYPTRTSMKTMRKRFLDAVAATGVPVNYTPAERSTEHLSSDEFQQRADRAKADAYLAADARKDAALYLDAAKRDAAAERAEWAEPDEHGQGEGPKRRRAREKAVQQGYVAGKAEGQAEAAQARQRAAQELQRAAQARAALERAQADWKAEAPTRAALLDEWLDLPLKNGGTRRDLFDAYTTHVADQWMKAHADDVSALDDDDLALLMQGGTAALDDALAEAQRDKRLR